METLVHSGEAVIVEFITTWCGACKSIEPLLHDLSTLHADDVQCAVVVCDKNKETKKLAAAFGVKSYPVFYVFDENGSEVQKWNGADRGKLEGAFIRLAGDGGGGKNRGRRGGGSKKKGRK